MNIEINVLKPKLIFLGKSSSLIYYGVFLQLVTEFIKYRFKQIL